MTSSNVQCDPESTIATLQLTNADSPSCNGSPRSSNYLVIELPSYDVLGSFEAPYCD